MNDYEKYFFNDLYDDRLVSSKLSSWRSRLYNNILDGKGWAQNNQVINGYIDTLVMDPAINLEYGMPEGTYSLQLRIPIIPFYAEKCFFDKYGYGHPITSMDILRDTHIFSKMIYFYVNEFLIHDVTFLIWPDRSIIFVKPTDTFDLTKDGIQEAITGPHGDGTWTIFLSTRSDYYITTMARNQLLTGKKIYTSKFTEIRRYNKPHKNNAWTLYITGGNSYNIMMSTPVVLQEDTNGEYFEITDEFNQVIHAVQNNLKCLVINEPDCCGSGVYIDNDDTQPIFRIPFEKNPIPVRNLIIWAYDADTHQKLHPLTPIVTLSYPNIYDFTEMVELSYLKVIFMSVSKLLYDVDGKVIVTNEDHAEPQKYDLYVEWIEPRDDISAYDSYIEDYIACYDDEYLDMVMNDSLPDQVKSYAPVQAYGDTAQDYLVSEYYGDHRAWELSLIHRVLADNPKRYDELYNAIYEKVKKYITRSYSYERNPHIYERSVMDTNEVFNGDSETRMKFREPHSYISVLDYRCKLKPIGIYFDGIFTYPTYTVMHGPTVYIFFPSSKIANQQTIQIDIDFKDYPIVDKLFGFLKEDSEYDMEEIHLNRNISLSNFLFYYEDTKEYISKDEFYLYAQIKIDTVKYLGSGIIDFAPYIPFREFLTDKDGLLVNPAEEEHDVITLRTKEMDCFLQLNEGNKDINIANLKISLIDRGALHDSEDRVIDPSDDYNYITMRDTVLYYDNNPLVRRRLRFATTDFYQKRVFKCTGRDWYIIGNTYVFPSFKGYRDVSRFRVFRDGYRLTVGYDYDIEFADVYGGNALFRFNNPPDGNYIIEYIGYDEDLVYDSTYGSLKNLGEILYMKDDDQFAPSGYQLVILQRAVDEGVFQNPEGLMFLSDIGDQPFNNKAYKIYIDGRRIPEFCIHIIAEGTMIIIDPPFEGINDDSLISIYKQRNDSDPYEYGGEHQFLDELSANDEKFRKYIIQKYKPV